MSKDPNWRRYYEKEAEIRDFHPDLDPVEIHRCRLGFRLLPRESFRHVLDVGCGDAFFCEYIRTRLSRLSNLTVRGVDLSTTRLMRATARYPQLPLVAGSLEALPFASGAFEVVTCIEVLEHLRDPLVALRELARVTSRYVVLTVPYEQQLREALCPVCLSKYPVDGHLTTFNLERITTLASETGLALERVETLVLPVGQGLGFPRWIVTIADWLRRVGGAKPEFLGVRMRKLPQAGRAASPWPAGHMPRST